MGGFLEEDPESSATNEQGHLWASVSSPEHCSSGSATGIQFLESGSRNQGQGTAHEFSGNEHEMSCLPFYKPRQGAEIPAKLGSRVQDLIKQYHHLSWFSLKAKRFICCEFPVMAIIVLNEKFHQESSVHQAFSSLLGLKSSD